MQRNQTINIYDRQGAFALVVEAANQSPILLETEGDQSSYDSAMERIRTIFGGSLVRWCVVRLVPVAGNELLLLDLQRLQPKEPTE